MVAPVAVWLGGPDIVLLRFNPYTGDGPDQPGGLAPVLTVNDKVYPAMTPDAAADLIEELRSEG